MSSGNIGNQLRGLRYRGNTLDQSMKNYDRLTPKLRLAIGQMPTKIHTGSVFKIYRVHGEAVALSALAKYARKVTEALATERAAVMKAASDKASAVALLREAGML